MEMKIFSFNNKGLMSSDLIEEVFLLFLIFDSDMADFGSSLLIIKLLLLFLLSDYSNDY